MRTASKTTLFITAIALAVGLSGCAAGQSTADACKIINTEGQKIAGDANSAMGDVGSDPTAAAKTLKKVSGQFEELGRKISNTEVKTAWDTFSKAYGDVAKVVESVTADVKADPSKATEAMSKLTDASKDITDAGAKLQEVCS